MGLLFLKNGHKKIAETIGISAIFALFGQTMVRIRGFEPPRKQYSHGPEPCASASSAISAYTMSFLTHKTYYTQCLTEMQVKFSFFINFFVAIFTV